MHMLNSYSYVDFHSKSIVMELLWKNRKKTVFYVFWKKKNNSLDFLSKHQIRIQRHKKHKGFKYQNSTKTFFYFPPNDWRKFSNHSLNIPLHSHSCYFLSLFCSQLNAFEPWNIFYKSFHVYIGRYLLLFITQDSYCIFVFKLF